MACMAVSTVPWAVMITTWASGRLPRTWPRRVRPSMPGMRMSSRIRSKGCASASRRAAVPSLTAVTWYPAPRKPFSSTQRSPSSSSAIRIRPSAICLSRDRQEAGHRGALARLARHLDGALVLLHDAVAERQPEPEPGVLRREKRGEQLGPRGLGDPLALVHDLHLSHA